MPHKLILAQIARHSPGNDGALLPALLQYVCQFTCIQCVLADAEFASERNHRFIRQELGAMRVIPAKRGKATWRQADRSLAELETVAFTDEMFARYAALLARYLDVIVASPPHIGRE